MQHCQCAVGFLDFLISGNGKELQYLYTSRKWKFRDTHTLYFISFAVVNWIDVFVRLAYKHTLMESRKYCQKNKSLEILRMVHHAKSCAHDYLDSRRQS